MKSASTTSMHWEFRPSRTKCLSGYWLRVFIAADQKCWLSVGARENGALRNVVWKCFAQVNFNIGVERTCGILAQCGHHEEASAVRSILAEVPQVDHRIGQRFEGVVQPAEAIEPKQQAAKFIFQPKTRSMVLNRSLKMAELKSGLRPRLELLRPRGFALILGTIPRLKMAFRFVRQS